MWISGYRARGGQSLATNLLGHEVKSVLFSQPQFLSFLLYSMKALNKIIFKALLGQNFYNFKVWKLFHTQLLVFHQTFFVH